MLTVRGTIVGLGIMIIGVDMTVAGDMTVVTVTATADTTTAVTMRIIVTIIVVPHREAEAVGAVAADLP
jgi:hypothetical protein